MVTENADTVATKATKRQQEAPVHHRPTCHHGFRIATIDGSTVRSARWTVYIAPRRFISSLARYPVLILGGLAVLGSSSINWSVRVWTKTSAYWAVKERLTNAIKQALDKHGIGMPYPQWTFTSITWDPDAEKAASTHDAGPVASARRRAKPTG